MSAAKMKHAFDGVTAEGLLVALECLCGYTYLDDDARPRQQVVTLGKHNQTDEWVLTMRNAEDGDATAPASDCRVFSSPELSHVIYSALVDHWAAFDHFKLKTGWSRPFIPKVKPLTRCAAGRDGECTHAQCPQLRDDEPRSSGRHCPLDK